MPSMYEIYARHAPEYDELVRAEDAAGQLPALLSDLATWKDSFVYEAGAGTGRVTAFYSEACQAAFVTDRSTHMLAFAAKKLAPFRHKLTFRQGENLALPAAPWLADIFIEGWSFGHTLLDGDNDSATTAALVAQAEAQVRGGGMVILIETLGTGVDQPAAPDEQLRAFTDRLETVHDFRRETIRTDYRFDSAEEAARVLGFFFGPEMGERVLAAGNKVIPEWTGVWWKVRGGQENRP